MKNLKFKNLINFVIYGIVICLILFFISIVITAIDINKSTPRQVYNIEDKKPPYDYLKSVTLYMVHPDLQLQAELNDGVFHGSVGTGVLLKQKEGYFYILTNKHICGDQKLPVSTFVYIKPWKRFRVTEITDYVPEKENCYVSLSGNVDKKDLIKI